MRKPKLKLYLTAQSVFQLPKIDKENFSTFRPRSKRPEGLRTLLTKALRSKRREVFFVYFRQLKNRLCCCYIKTLPRCTLVILDKTISFIPQRSSEKHLPDPVITANFLILTIHALLHLCFILVERHVSLTILSYNLLTIGVYRSHLS